MRKNSIDMYTSYHVYLASSFRDFPPVIGFGFGKKLTYDFLARTLPYHKQEIEKRNPLKVG